MSEGFKGERAITILSISLGIVSTLLIIKVMTMQHQFFKQKLEDMQNGKE
jgi:hypothetical protein